MIWLGFQRVVVSSTFLVQLRNFGGLVKYVPVVRLIDNDASFHGMLGSSQHTIFVSYPLFVNAFLRKMLSVSASINSILDTKNTVSKQPPSMRARAWIRLIPLVARARAI